MALNILSFFILFPLFSLSFSAHSLSTFSISENPTSNQTLICSLDLRSSLTCSSFPAGIRVPLNQNASFSGVVSGEGFVCGLRTFTSLSTSAIACWRFSANNGTDMSYKRIYRGPVITQLEAGNSSVCGLVNGTDRLRCWQWRGYSSNWTPSFSSIAVGEDFVCGLSESGQVSCFGGNMIVTRNVPNGSFSSIAAGIGHACVTNLTGDLNCWGNTAAAAPQGKFSAVALGGNRSCGLRVNGTVVCWGQGNFRLPEELAGYGFVSIEGKRNVSCGVLALNYSLVCWGDPNFVSDFVLLPETLPGPCTKQCRCGLLSGSANFCSGGEFICQPCSPHISVPPPPPPPAVAPPSPGSSWNGRMTAFLVVGCVGSASLLLALGFFVFRYCKSRGGRVHDSGPLDEARTAAASKEGGSRSHDQNRPQVVIEKRLSKLTSMGTQLEEFNLRLLLEATNNFSDDRKIGSGSFGSVYKATLEDGREVAIKRAELYASTSYAWVTRRQEDNDSAFVNELEALSRLHHKNLVRLLGFCEDSNELVLVYEYMSNGTLYDHLHRLNDSPLMMSWAARIKVAMDAARGIEYLHEYAVPPTIHRDIKSSNILLDSTWTAKVSDFGLSLMGPSDEESHLSLRAAGTVGYIDPEYYRLQQLTKKSDVYSFGVVLLELLSGQKAIHKTEYEVARNVVDYMVPYVIQDEIHRVLDRRVPAPTPFEIEAVAYVGYLAVDCVRLEGRDRPSMTEIVNSLERALGACLAPPTLSRSTTESST